jgi:peroxiredoxin
VSAVPDDRSGLPAIGARAPEFTLPDLEARQVSLADLLATHHLMIFFMREFT